MKAIGQQRQVLANKFKRRFASNDGHELIKEFATPLLPMVR